MKKYLTLLLLVIFSILFSFAQTIQQAPQQPARLNYDVLKRTNLLPSRDAYMFNPDASRTVPKQSRIAPHSQLRTSITCNCMLPLDSTYSVGEFDCTGGSGGPGIPPYYRNDDWSTCAIQIPFSFCLYGVNYTDLYINNNGNISFSAPYSTFTSTPFPNTQYIMVAPFWADVDTRDDILPDTSGIVYYKITPTALIVKWNFVGYYGVHADLLNEFQLIITDGNDPLLPGGNNVSFCYGDMQWTTGDASGGQNGFGGTAATVGANLGDGVNYIQFGEFDHPGIDYNGPNTASGVSWLDNQSIIFNTCTSNNNISPVAVGLNECDTISICAGDTLNFSVSFHSPELNQLTTANATTTPGLLGFTILSNIPGNSAVLSAQLIANAANSGYYTITFSGTDNNSTPATTNVPIVIYIRPFAAPLPVITGPSSYCPPGSVTISVPAVYSHYLWNNGDTTNSVTVSAGTYTVMVTDTNGCHATSAPFTVTANGNLSPVITGAQGVCPNATTQLSLTLTYPQYLWSNSSSASSITVSAGTYTVTVTDASGCTGTASFTVIQYQNPVITSTGNASMCIGQSTVLAVSGADSYVWSPATALSATTGNSVTANPTVTTTYTVVGTNTATGCTGSTTITVTVNPLPLVVTPPAPVICAGGNVNITLSGAASYHWSPTTGISSTNGPDSSSVNISLSQTTCYTVTGFSVEGCSATTSFCVTVNPNPVPVIVPSGPTVFCAGGNVNLTATPAGTYLWNNSTTSQVINVTSSGTFTVTVTDANGCSGVSAPQSVTVNPNPAPVINPSGPTTFCAGGSVILNCQPAYTGGSYLWSNSAATQSITVSSSGTFTVTATDANGCVGTSSPVTVTVNPLPVASIVPDGPLAFCQGGSVMLSANGGTSYQWSNSSSSQNISVIASGTFTVIVTDANGCSATASETVTVHPLPVAVITPDGPLTFCSGEDVNLTASGGISFLWSNTSTSATQNVNSSGTYTVTVTDVNNCTATTSETVTVIPPPPAVVTPPGPVTICTNNPATLTASTGPGYTYQWYFNSTVMTGETTSQISTLITGAYSVIVTDGNGCYSSSNVVQVTQGVGPPVSITSPSPVGCLQNTIYIGYGPQSIQLCADAPASAASFLWSTGETTQCINVSTPGNYSVIAFDINGCPSPNPAVLSPGIQVIDIRCGHGLKKILICHVPEGQPGNPQTLCIGPPAIPPHLALHRYDCLGPCSLYYREDKMIEAENFLVLPHPNPFNNGFNLTIFTASSNAVTVNIHDMLGQIVESYSNVTEQTFIGTKLTPGIYFAEVIQDDNRQMIQIVKAE